jgi:hypothetical protein
LHVGEPHQVDLWRIARAPLGTRDLHAMIAAVVDAAVPGASWRAVPASHPYTTDGIQIDVDAGEWIEIGECGLAAIAPPGRYGLAMGLGLDRLLMVRKGIDDIRLPRATDPRIAMQMLDLAPYRPVSAMPEVRRDLSIAVGRSANHVGREPRSIAGEVIRDAGVPWSGSRRSMAARPWVDPTSEHLCDPVESALARLDAVDTASIPRNRAPLVTELRIDDRNDGRYRRRYVFRKNRPLIAGANGRSYAVET